MFKPEQLAKAKATKSVEELLAYAKEVGYALTEKEAKVFFEQWNKEGELSDEELENVSGGSFVSGCTSYSDNYPHWMITTGGNSCKLYKKRSDPISYGAAEGTCWYCVNAEHTGDLITYCHARRYGADPIKS